MRLYVNIQLDTGGVINLSGSNLSTEDVSAAFNLLANHTVQTVTVEDEAIDTPLPEK